MGKWYENAVFYHMYPIGMTGAPRRNESEETVHRFQDLMKWLPHIKDLGCTAIYIGPLFESTSHGYDTKDYRMVDRQVDWETTRTLKALWKKLTKWTSGL